MKQHPQDPDVPKQSINDALQQSISLSNHLPSNENNNSSSQQQQRIPAITTRENNSSSRITLNRILRSATSQHNPGSASADGSADEPLIVNHPVFLTVGTMTNGANSPPHSNASQLNQITVLHQEAAIKFNGNI